MDVALGSEHVGRQRPKFERRIDGVKVHAVEGSEAIDGEPRREINHHSAVTRRGSSISKIEVVVRDGGDEVVELCASDGSLEREWSGNVGEHEIGGRGIGFSTAEQVTTTIVDGLESEPACVGAQAEGSF